MSEQKETLPPQSPPVMSADFPPASLDVIGGDLIESAPQSEPEFVAKLQAELTEELGASETYQTGAPAPAESEIVRDKSGHIFDPELCMVDADGNPEYTKTGLFELRRGVKRSRLRKTIRVPKPATPAAPAGLAPVSGPPVPDAAEMTARTVDSGYWSIMGFFGGTKNDAVSAMATEQMTTAFRAMEKPPSVPWWVGVAAIYGAQTGHILNQPAARPATRKIKDKLAAWYLRFKARKVAPEVG